MKQYGYSYDEYVKAQIAANKRKRNIVWVSKKNIAFLSDYIRARGIEPERIVCQGTRNGAEQRYFSEHFPNAEIIGTEIAPDAGQYPMTVSHDFHEPMGVHADVMYTNSFDHVFDPHKALGTWMAETDMLLLEHSDCDFDDKVTEHDPFGASFEEVHDLLDQYGEVIEILDLPDVHIGATEQRVFVCMSSP